MTLLIDRTDARHAVSLYVDLRLAMIDGRAHSVESAHAIVANKYGVPAADHAIAACNDKLPVRETP